MGIGFRLVQVDCNIESASGAWARRRNRQRRRGSDELAIFVSMHDLITERHLAFYRFHRGNVDSGDTFRPNQSMLAPEDSSDQVLLTLVALEIDGAGSLGKIVEKEYERWKQVSIQLGNFNLPPGEGGRAISKGTAIVNMGFAWLGEEVNHDLIALDRFSASSAPMSDIINGGPVPEREGMRSIEGRGISTETSFARVDDQLITSRTYESSEANSRYTFHIGMRTR